jgi:hypothetical protein
VGSFQIVQVIIHTLPAYAFERCGTHHTIMR